MNGKGDKARPFNVSRETYEDRYDAIFGKKKETVVVQDDLYENSPFHKWMQECPVEYTEDYTDNHGTRAGYTFWIEEV